MQEGDNARSLYDMILALVETTVIETDNFTLDEKPSQENREALGLKCFVESRC